MAEPKWRFRWFVDDDGSTPYRDWYESLPASAQAAIDARLELIGTQATLERPYVGHEGSGIIKVRLKDIEQKIQYRILSCYGPTPGDITMLVGAIEKGNKLPPGTEATAFRRKAIIDKRKQKARDDRERNTKKTRAH